MSLTQERPSTNLPAFDNLRGRRVMQGNRYTSAEFFAAEWEHMWTKVWLLLGRASEIPEPGDYQMEMVGRESILMVRQRDGAVRAFYNLCQHRGNRLIAGAEGGLDYFVCAYHGWKWDLDGELLWAQDEDDYPGGLCGKVRLAEIPCEVLAGFIWVNMDPDCGTLKDYLGPVWDGLQTYPVAEMRRYQAMTVNMPCNWKVIQDNFHESYHLPAVHPEAGVVIEDDYKDTEFFNLANGHTLMKMKSGRPARRLGAQAPIDPLLAGMMQEWDLDPADFADRPFDIRLALQAQKRKLGPARGYTHYDKMSDDQLTDFYHYTFFPNFSVSITADGFHFLRVRPHGTDPNFCVFDNWFYATEPAGVTTPVFTPGGPVERGADVQHDVFNYLEKSLGYVMDQDMSITTGQQNGFRSRGYQGAVLTGQEARILHYQNTVDAYISGASLPAGFAVYPA
jgi:phenylpropionate dioxygenase-like ring-hydroxylating dioxygenase large terminal subunit